MRVHFLFDPSNDWLRPHLRQVMEAYRHRYEISEAEDPTACEVMFILGHTKIISREVLNQNKLNLVVHESALPSGRGFSPVQWQVFAGASRIPVCMIDANAEVDSGDIIDTDVIELEGHELLPQIRALQALATVRLIRRLLDGYPKYNRTRQVGKSSTFPRRRDKDDALDADKTLREQFNHLRIADNDRHPLYFEINGHRYTVTVTKASPSARIGS